ncbi:hypothetical protein LCGC14_3022980, partial [marine sediment metagenome]
MEQSQAGIENAIVVAGGVELAWHVAAVV